MSAHDEEDRLRSVAMQNARGILVARQRAEETLQKQTEWLRITLASIADAVISTDAEGRVNFINRMAETLTGWPWAEAVGRPLSEVLRIINEHTRLPAENPAHSRSPDGSLVGFADGTILIARNGVERPIEDSAALIRDDSGVSVGAVFVFRDVSERRQSDEARVRLAAIVESSDDAIVSKSLEGIVRSWNAGAERLFGFTAGEMIGQPITRIIPEDHLDEEQEILARISRGERVAHFETVRVTKQGRRINISLTVSPLRDSTGRIIGASKVARDITDRKRVEEALRQADQRKDQFIALVAHELRNPLAPLRNGLQVIRMAGNDPNAVAQARGMMERQLGHLVRLVDDLLDIARISQNKMELRRTRVLLSDIVRSGVETARPMIQEAGHELCLSLPSDPIYLDADLTRLAQVLSNLLTNSAKYTERGGRIWLTAEQAGNSVIIRVRDTGIGIPPHALPRIFDMFSQVDRNTERESGGLGIGLALVKGLVEMHDGAVTAASDGQGLGSTFTITLPTLFSSAEIQPPAAIDAAEPSAGPRQRILVVDDNAAAAASMAMIFKLMGDEVRTAHDGIEAVEEAESFAPDVILMDIGMPRLNGYDATQRIREQQWGRDIIIIALTGWGQDLDRVQSQKAGCDGHLVKPVNLTDLEALLKKLSDAKYSGSPIE